MYIENECKQGVEKNICTLDGGNKRTLEKKSF
jgi:hypothetical protein